MGSDALRISADGETLAAAEVLTGRGFITGKSGAGKSNTARVVTEELLAGGYPLFVIDADGEYAGLADRYDAIRAGATDDCDVVTDEDNIGRLARRAVTEPVPVVFDVSTYLDMSKVNEFVGRIAEALFQSARDHPTPFLLLVEEIHEYLPQTGGIDETGERLVRIAKRGRKHGLGLCGISQRPADVKKDFITQCDWFVWHRLTWENDTRIVGRLLDTEAAETVPDLNDGEALVVTDWDSQIRRVQFRRCRTGDGGAPPSLDGVRVVSATSVAADLQEDLATDGDGSPEIPDNGVDRIDTNREREPDDNPAEPSTGEVRIDGIENRSRRGDQISMGKQSRRTDSADHDRPADDAEVPAIYELGVLVIHLGHATMTRLVRMGRHGAAGVSKLVIRSARNATGRLGGRRKK